jgi:hypothetical protein
MEKGVVKKNGDNGELGDDGIILRHCIPGGLVHIWLTGCGTIGYHCHVPDGHYQNEVDTRVRVS